MKSTLLYGAIASCLTLQLSCTDDNKEENYDATLYANEETIEINADALYSTHHTFLRNEAEVLALNTAKLLFEGNNTNGLKSAASDRQVASTAVLLSPKDGLKSAHSFMPDTLAYVVNFTGQKGFALISADDRSVSRVLACFDNGEYDAKKINEVPFMTEMLTKAQQKITNDIYNFEAYKEMAKAYYGTKGLSELKASKIQIVTNSCGPFLHTTWGQTKKYNRYCPPCQEPGCPNTSVVGCVNLALGEILSYYRPEKMFSYNGKTMFTLDWKSMQKTPTIGAELDEIPSTQKTKHFKDNEGVQILLAQMAYGGLDLSRNNCIDHGATGYSLKRLNELCTGGNVFLRRNGFQVDMITNVNVDSLGLYNWRQLKKTCDFGKTIIEQLKSNPRPVMLIGSGASCHAWVADGYKTIQRNYNILVINNGTTITEKISTTDNYIHHNWGWDGICNGYFNSNLFNSDDSTTYDYPKRINNKEYTNYCYFLLFDIYR